MSGVYDEAYFRAGTIQEVAKNMVKVLDALNSTRRRKIRNVLSRGASGCAIASAILALTGDQELHHVFVRKPHEEAHGKSTHAGDFADGDCVIVDDFISTGKTVGAIKEFATEQDKKVVAILVGDNGYCFMHVRPGWKVPVIHCGKLDACYLQTVRGEIFPILKKALAKNLLPSKIGK